MSRSHGEQPEADLRDPGGGSALFLGKARRRRRRHGFLVRREAILLEQGPEIYELLDLNTGICRMAVAAPKGFRDDTRRPLRVATKFPHIAERYYTSLGREIDIIHLNGSIEIAPILGLSDVIVDIVETGTTLRENDLEVVEDIFPISARLIANKASFKFKTSEIEKLVSKLSEEA